MRSAFLPLAVSGLAMVSIMTSPAHSQSAADEVMETFKLVCLEGLSDFESISKLAEKRGFSDPMGQSRALVALVRGHKTSVNLNKDLKLCTVYSEALSETAIRLWLISNVELQKGSIGGRELEGTYKSQRLSFRVGGVPDKGALVQVTFSQSGVWTPGEETSRIDGTKRIYIWRKSTEEMRYDGTMRDRPSILIQCRSGAPFVWFQFERVMTGDGQMIAYKIDEKPPQKIWMTISTSHTSLGLSGAHATAFAKRLLGAKQLHIRATPHGSGPVEVSFDLSGIDEAAKPVRQACKW